MMFDEGDEWGYLFSNNAEVMGVVGPQSPNEIT
jgi:hypothetical protein